MVEVGHVYREENEETMSRELSPRCLGRKIWGKEEVEERGRLSFECGYEKKGQRSQE